MLMPQGTLVGLLCKLLKPTDGKDYTFPLLSRRLGVLLRTQRGQVRPETVTSCHIWSVFLLRFIYSFAYFREILPREQVRLSALTRG